MWNGVMTMTDEEWEKVEKSLSRPYGHAKFMIDGYTVDIAVQPEKKLKYVLTVYETRNVHYTLASTTVIFAAGFIIRQSIRAFLRLTSKS